MAKTNALDPKIEYGMLGETAMDEIRALVSGLGDHATFEELETGAVKIARQLERMVMQATLEIAEKKLQGEKKMSEMPFDPYLFP
jgi:hypothetical protein